MLLHPIAAATGSRNTPLTFVWEKNAKIPFSLAFDPFCLGCSLDPEILNKTQTEA